MLELLLGPVGSGKSSSLPRRIREASALGKRAFVIIPEQFSLEYERKLFYSLGAELFNKIEVRSFSRLAADIIAASGNAHGRYADDTAKTVLMLSAIKSASDAGCLSFYEHQANSDGFAELVLKSCSDLRVAGITPSQLAVRAAATSGTLRDKLLDIAELYTRYTALLSENQLLDSLESIAEASGERVRGDFFQNAIVFVDEFKSFTTDELLMLEAIIIDSSLMVLLDTESLVSKQPLFSSVNETCLTLSGLAEKNGVNVRRTWLREQMRYNNPGLTRLSSSIFRNEKREPISTDAIHIVEAENVYDEAAFVCAEIIRLIHQNKWRFSDIAIAARSLDDYSRILPATAERYGIPLYLSQSRCPINTAAGTFILTALELAARNVPTTELMLRYSKNGLAGLTDEQSAFLENYCFIWGVEGEAWLEPFAREQDDAAEPIRVMLIPPLKKLHDSCQNATVAQICQALYAFFQETAFASQLVKLTDGIKELSDSGFSDAIERSRELKTIWEVIMSLLDSIHRNAGNQQMSCADFRKMLRIMLAQARYTMAPPSVDAVTVTELQKSRFNSPKAVFILGANEGLFPYTQPSGGLFSERDAQEMKKVGLELFKTASQIFSEECFAAYAAMSAPSDELYITHPMLSAAGKSCVPAYTLKRISALFANDLRIFTKNLPPEYFVRTLPSAYSAFVASYSENNELKQALSSILTKDKDYASRIGKLLDCASGEAPRLTDKELIRKLYGKQINLSATLLESYSKCPFSFYCNYGLNLYPLRKKEISALDRGKMIHYCLERFFSEHTRDEVLSISDDAISDFVLKCLMDYLERELGGAAKTESFKAAAARISEGTAELIILMREELNVSAFYPDSLELSVGKHNPTVLRCDNGTELTFSGTVDRVDICEIDGKKFIRVIDYKTGKKSFELADILYGLNMQMLLYIFALTTAGARYDGYEPAGVLYYPAGALNTSAMTLDRNADSNDIHRARLKGHCMSGILLEDMDIIKAMDGTFSTLFVPVKLNKDGTIAKYSQKYCHSKQNIAILREYSEYVLITTASRITDGRIAVEPLENACTYCNYHAICGGVCDEPSYRTLDKKPADMLDELFGGEQFDNVSIV